MNSILDELNEQLLQLQYILNLYDSNSEYINCMYSRQEVIEAIRQIQKEIHFNTKR